VTLPTIEPMLAIPADVSAESLYGTHAFDTKLDGVRMMAYWDGGALTLRNRRMVNRNVTYPDLIEAFPDLPGAAIFDGEVIAGKGFQDVARRDKATKAFAARQFAISMPATFVAFDILWRGDIDLRGEPYHVRRDLLERLRDNTFGEHWAVSEASEDLAYVERVRAAGGEGVIAKRLTGRYTSGRSRQWMKFKNTHSITCVATGYSPGTGSRADFGAMTLAVIDGDTVKVIGRVGSGLTSREVSTLRGIFDAAKTDVGLLPVIEVECLGLTRDGVLRQPVYKGRRSDLTIHDATATQLEGLPRS
jgi:ATP-dependent DNA ligase